MNQFVRTIFQMRFLSQGFPGKSLIFKKWELKNRIFHLRIFHFFVENCVPVFGRIRLGVKMGNKYCVSFALCLMKNGTATRSFFYLPRCSKNGNNLRPNFSFFNWCQFQ